MARIAGIDVPREKRIEAALPYVFGVGPASSRVILKKAKIDPNKRAKDLSEEELSKIGEIIEKEFYSIKR